MRPLLARFTRGWSVDGSFAPETDKSSAALLSKPELGLLDRFECSIGSCYEAATEALSSLRIPIRGFKLLEA
jgi:hypothetical protein